MFLPIPTSALSSELVSLAGLFAFHVLTNPNLCPLQEVSVPCWLVCFPCSDQSQPLPSPASECPLLACFLFIFSPIPNPSPSSVRLCLACFPDFSFLTNL